MWSYQLDESLTVIDFFCGAGGFSEGFRQNGFKIIRGIDNWKPAIDTYNFNFELNCSVKNVLDFEKSIEEIEQIENSDVILGSPPCVSFSNSNKSGKADKALGVKLVEVFLRIVAIKKYMKDSILKAWYMENVPNSQKHLKDKYSFVDLGLSDWAETNGIDAESIAIDITDSKFVVDAANYGTPQHRKRLITGEIVNLKKLPLPSYTHGQESIFEKDFITLSLIKNHLPCPTCHNQNRLVVDPNYPNLEISSELLSDHFYDTGIYESEWKDSLFLKQNHPYMGKMSFPENETKPSRTVTATNIAASREALIYRSEIYRKGNGEYRKPTIRETGCLMGFPITYQFIGSEHTKARLVGNAVCPPLSSHLAKNLLEILELPILEIPIFTNIVVPNPTNLNVDTLKLFNNPPQRKPGSRFRRHPLKENNITVSLSNYQIKESEPKRNGWYCSIQKGTGIDFITIEIPNGYCFTIEDRIMILEKGEEFLTTYYQHIGNKIAKSETLQKMYEEKMNFNEYLEPSTLIALLGEKIAEFKIDNNKISTLNFPYIDRLEYFTVRQLFALYAVSHITTIANN